MNFAKKLLNKLDNYIYYLELNSLIYITSAVTLFILWTIFCMYPYGNFFTLPILLIAIPTTYIIILVLLCIYNINKLLFDKHISFSVIFPKWYKCFWRFNVILNICFHLFILYLILDILSELWQ